MIKINAKIDTPFFKQLKTVTTESGRQSMSMAINDSLKAGRTSLKREISQMYNLKQKEIETNSRINKSSVSNLKGGNIKVSSRRLTIGTTTHFSITPRQYSSQKGIKVKKRKKVTATIKKGNKVTMKNTFIANPNAKEIQKRGGNTMLWIRLSSDGKKIAPLKTISIPQMAENKDVIKSVQDVMKEKYNKRFEHYMNRSLGKVKGS